MKYLNLFFKEFIIGVKETPRMYFAPILSLIKLITK